MSGFEDLGALPVRPAGQPASEDFSDLGAIPESQEEEGLRVEKAEYDNPAIAGTLGVARGLSFGLSDLAARFLGKAETVEKYRRYNPGASIAGDVVGTVAPVLLTAGTSLAATGAGKAAAMTGGSLAAKAGAKVAATTASKFASKAGARAAGAAAEGALLGVKESITDLSLTPQDVTPEVAGEVLLSNVGLGAVLGGGFSLGTSAVGAGIKGTRNSFREISKKFIGPGSKTAQEGAESLTENSLKTQGNFISDQLTLEKPNAAAIRNSAEELAKFTGTEVKPTTGMLSGSPVIQGLESSLDQAPTLAGAAVRAETGAVKKGVTEAAERVLYERGEQTAVQVGDGVKEGLIDGFERAFKPLGKSYDDIAKATNFIEISEASRKSVADSFLRLKSVKVSPNSPTAGAIKAFAKDLTENVKTADDLKFLRSQVGDALAEARASRNATAVAEFSEVYKRMSGMRSRWIKRAAMEQASSGPEGAEIAKGLLKEIEKTDAGFKALKNELSDLSKNAKLGRIETVDQLVNALDKIPSEQITDRLMNTKNSKLLKYVKESFPEQFNQMKGLKLQKLYEQSLEGRTGEFSIAKFVKATEKISPEAQDVLFSGVEQRAIKNIKTLYQASPKMVGPSGTPQGLDFQNLFTIQGLGLNFRDAVRYAAYRGQGFVSELVQETESQSKKRINLFVKSLGSASRNVGDTTRRTASLLKLDDANFMGRVERLAELTSNPGRLTEELAKNTEGVSEDPQLQTSLNTQATTALLYLQNAAPKNPRTSSIFQNADANWKPSQSDIRRFSRVVRAIDDPLSILDDINAGVLSPDSVNAVKAVYPEIYSVMVRETVEQMSGSKGATKLSASDKVQLSILLGMPVDSSLDPAFVNTIQNTFSGADEPESPQSAPGQTKARPAGMDNLTRDISSATPTEKLLQR
jgi:hypothetical protein